MRRENEIEWLLYHLEKTAHAVEQQNELLTRQFKRLEFELKQYDYLRILSEADITYLTNQVQLIKSKRKRDR